ncbi:MAG: family 78 glycoside hydrolase catalytic domain, partial [Acidobacteria bacterium]|nr:family 78 glycoside hydrolase catalytic domain [Acidobacteriota bacterium]
MQLHHPEPFTGRWRARWIWQGRPALTLETATRPVLADPTDRVVLFRREFTLDAVPVTVPTRLWVDGRYLLHVNGVEVGRGPVRSDPRAAHYDLVDLAPHLRVGTNVIAIVARHFGHATSWWIPVPPSYALGAGSLVFEAHLGGDEWLLTDRSWRCTRGEAWTPVPIPGDVACLPLESFDATRSDAGWLEAGFDDSDWSKAFEITPAHTGGHLVPTAPSEPFGMLRPPVRRAFQDGAVHTAALLGTRRVAGVEFGPDPVRQVLDDEAGEDLVDGQVEIRRFDLGRIAAGTVVLAVAGAAEGTVLDLAASEHVSAEGRLVTLGQHAGLRYVCRGDATEDFESFDIIGTRYLHCAIRTPQGASAPEVTVAVHDRHRPRPAGAAFACSDPLLEQIHAVGLRTVDLCALDAYVDCPTREQRAWTGDSVVHQLVDLTNNPDWSMPIWHPQLATMARSDGMLAMAVASDFAADDRTIVPDWSLHWIHSVHNLHRYTGDRAVVAELLSSASRALRWFESYLGDDGLLADVTGWVLLDWSSVYSKGCSSTLNALWGRALVEFAEMSRWLGNEGDAAWAMAHHERLRAAFEIFWDEDRGVYIDHIVDGVPQRAAAQ